MEVKDTHGRTFRTLRVSLTSTCNFGCVYCVNGEDAGGFNNGVRETVPLHYSELADIVIRLHKRLQLRTIRLTGGEPTLYHDLIPFITKLTSHGISHIKITTNAFLMKSKAEALSAAGVKAINVSLDAVDPEIFKKVSRRNSLQTVLEGIDAALQHGIAVKINSVIMREVNEDQILPLLHYARTKNISLRFLELMRMGHFFSEQFDRYFYPMADIIDVVRKEYHIEPLSRKVSATAERWKMDDGYEFGIIANESVPFCSDCDRLRLDSYGNIYGCLSEDKKEYIGASPDAAELDEKLHLALTHKQPLKFKGSPMTMISIGG